MFWQEKSSKLIWIFALTWKLKQVYMNLCFDKRNQSDQYLQVTYYIFSNQICFLTGKIQKIDLNFVFWQVKSNKFISICVFDKKNPVNWFKVLHKRNQSDQFLVDMFFTVCLILVNMDQNTGCDWYSWILIREWSILH